MELFDPLIDVLHDNRELTLAGQLTEPHFIIAVQILSKVLGVTKGLSEILQAKELDLITAVQEIEAVVGTLSDWRTDNNDSEFSAVFAAASKMYAKVENMPDIEFPKPRVAGRQCNRNNVPADSALDYYKRAVWYPLLDCFQQEIRHRFSSHSKAAMSMCALLPSKCVEATFDSVAGSLKLYGSFLPAGPDACQAEFGRWQRKWQQAPLDKRPSTLIDALKSCNRALYPNVFILLQIFATIPVTTATSERSFSSLRLLKTYLRSTMKEERLNGLALMAIHKDVRFKYDDVITEYATQHDRRFRFQ